MVGVRAQCAPHPPTHCFPPSPQIGRIKRSKGSNEQPLFARALGVKIVVIHGGQEGLDLLGKSK